MGLDGEERRAGGWRPAWWWMRWLAHPTRLRKETTTTNCDW